MKHHELNNSRLDSLKVADHEEDSNRLRRIRAKIRAAKTIYREYESSEAVAPENLFDMREIKGRLYMKFVRGSSIAEVSSPLEYEETGD